MGKRSRTSRRQGQSNQNHQHVVAEALEPRLLMSTTLLSENFETAFPATNGWGVNVSQGRQWNAVSTRAHGGTMSGFCADVGTTYTNNQVTVMGKTVSLAGFSAASLSFYSWENTEPNFDFLNVRINGTVVWSQSGNHQSWTKQTLDLSAYAGQPAVNVAFEFVSDTGTVAGPDGGAYVDDILLTADGADAALTTVAVSPTRFISGLMPPGNLDLTIQNNGPGSINNVQYGAAFYLSTNNSLSAGDIAIGGAPLMLTIPNGGSTSVSLPNSFFVPPLTPGNYYTGVHLVNLPGTLIDPKDSNNWLIGNQINIDTAGQSPTDLPRNMGVLGGVATTVNEYVGALDPDDFYTVTLPGPAVITVTLTGLSANADLRLLDTAGNEVAGSTQPGTTSETLTYTAPMGGTYFIGVNQISGETSYTVGARVQPYLADVAMTSVTMNGPRVAPGGHPASLGYTVLNNGPASIVAAPYTADIYLSTNNSISTADLKIGTINTAVTASSGNSSALTTAAGVLSTITVPNTLAPGNYYVGMHIMANPSPGVVFDPKDSNNWIAGNLINVDTAGQDIGNARNLGALTGATATIKEFVGDMDPDDFYRVTISGPGIINLSLTGLASDADLRLLDSAGHQVASSNQPGTTSESLSYTVAGAGTYYINVNHIIGGDTTYNLNTSVQWTTDDVALTALTVGGTRILTGGHPTSVAYTVHNNGPADLSNSPYRVDLYLSLNNSISAGDIGMGSTTDSMTLVSGGTSARTTPGGGLASFTVPAGLTPGNYYVGMHISPQAGALTDPQDANNWRVGNLINVDTAGQSIADYRSLGALGNVATTASEFVGSLDADDFYRVTVTGPGLITVNLTGLAADANLRLLDSGGNQVAASSLAGTANETIAFNAVAGGAYYIDVRQVSGDTNYSLSARYQAAAADVALTALTAGPTRVAVGDHPTSLLYTIQNNGPTPTGGAPYLVDLYLSTNNSVSSADTYIGSNTLALTIPNGGSSAIVTSAGNLASFTVPATMPAGNYYVGMHITPQFGALNDPRDVDNWIVGNLINIDTAGQTLVTSRNLGPLSTTAKVVKEFVGNLDTVDIYRVSTPGAGVINASLSGLSADADLYLLDSAGNQVASSTLGGTTVDSIAYNTSTGGTYYIRVIQGSGDANYTLTVSDPPAPVGAPAPAARPVARTAAPAPVAPVVTAKVATAGSSALAVNQVSADILAAAARTSVPHVSSFSQQAASVDDLLLSALPLNILAKAV